MHQQLCCAARRPVPPLRAGRDSRTTAIFPRLRRRDNCPRAPATEWCETAAFITLGQKTPRRRASPLLCRIRITRSDLEGQRRLRPRVFGGNYSPFFELFRSACANSKHHSAYGGFDGCWSVIQWNVLGRPKIENTAFNPQEDLLKQREWLVQNFMNLYIHTGQKNIYIIASKCWKISSYKT